MTLPFESRETRDAATTLEGVLERIVFSNEPVERLALLGDRFRAALGSPA